MGNEVYLYNVLGQGQVIYPTSLQGRYKTITRLLHGVIYEGYRHNQ